MFLLFHHFDCNTVYISKRDNLKMRVGGQGVSSLGYPAQICYELEKKGCL